MKYKWNKLLTCLLCIQQIVILFIGNAPIQVQSATVLPAGMEVFGITYANIDTFGYYQYQDGYSTYGAGLDVKWKLPAEAKAGDYFTLRIGNEILLNRAPMYSNNETVPYSQLDKVGDRYPEVHVKNLFFQIVTMGSATEPAGIPILNVYYTKEQELTFVVQKYANDKGAIEGEAIVGHRINEDAVTAITDGNGRHRSNKRIRPNGDDTKLTWDKYDLVDQLQRYDFYEGFYPNFLLFTPQAGATATNGDPYFLGRKITYVSQYMNDTPVTLDDANRDPNLSGAYINQRTQLFEKTHDAGYNEPRKQSYGREIIYPVKEDRTHIYYYFNYNSNRNDTGEGAWQVYLKPELATIDIEEVKLFQGYNGRYANDRPVSMVPNMATVDPLNVDQGIQVDTGKRFVRQANGEWYADFGGNEKRNTYFAIIKARKVAAKPIPEENGKYGYVMRMSSRNNVFSWRNQVDYYVPTEGLGSGWSDADTAKDLLGDFKIKKIDENKDIIYPNYDLNNNNLQYEDSHDNIYLYDNSTNTLVDRNNRRLTHLRDVNGNLLFEDDLYRLFTKRSDGTYTDATGVIYRQKEANSDIYVSSMGSIFKPTRPLLKDYDVVVKIDGNVVTDQQGETLPTISITKGILEVTDRFSNLIRIQKNGTTVRAWKFDPRQSQWVEASVQQEGNYYRILALPISTTRIRPKLRDTISFKITDTVYGTVFNHNVDEYGYAIFPSLLIGHTYRLEETATIDGLERMTKRYLLTVTGKNQVRVSDENGAQITSDSSPLSIDNANNLIYSVINNSSPVDLKFTKKIKGLESIPNLINSPVTFKLTKISANDFTPVQKTQAANTTFLFNNLSSGVYQLDEVSPPVGYVKDGTPYTVVVNKGQVKFYSKKQERTSKASDLRIIKSSHFNTATIPNAETSAVDSSDNTVSLYQLSPDTIYADQWWGADLGSIQNISSMRLLQGGITGQGSARDKMDNFVLESSIDGKTYTTVQTFNNAGLEVNATFDVFARYIRIRNLTQKTRVWFGVRDFTLMIKEPIDGEHNYRYGSTITRVSNPIYFKSDVFNTFQSGNDSNAIDDNRNSAVIYNNLPNNRIPQNAYIGIDLQSVQRVRNIHYLQGHTGNANDKMDRFSVEYSIDGNSYTVLQEYNGNNEVNINTDIRARYIRIKNLQQSTRNVWFGVRDLSVTAHNIESDEVVYSIGNIQNPTLRIEKHNLNNQLIQKNVTFKLYKVPDDTTDSNIQSAITANNLVQQFNLVNGIFQDTLRITELGKYALVETQPPENYIGLEQPILIEAYETTQAHNATLNKYVTRFRVLTQTTDVRFDDTQTSQNNILKLYVKNKRKINFSIEKVGSDDPTKTLLNVQFELKAKAGSQSPKFSDNQWDINNYRAEINETQKSLKWYTSQSGNAVFVLAEGTYILSELKSPEGYTTFEPFEFEVTSDGQIRLPQTLPNGLAELSVKDGRIHLKLTNKLEKRGFFPNTGGLGILPFIIAGGGLMIISIVNQYKKRKK